MMRYCGRDFTEEELAWIRRLIAEEPKRTRFDISQQVCRAFGWHKPDGGLKEMSCRVALLRMHREGLITLPPPRRKNGNGKAYTRRTPEAEPRLHVPLPPGALATLEVELVSTRKQSALWNEYIARYHYLGYKPLPGAQLRYMVSFRNEEVALFGFGASAWKTASRDRFIGWSCEQRKARLHLVVNNARFLILPWVQCRNLASKALSLVTKRLALDWQERYGYKPVLIETFVQSDRFHGTSYKAANWIHVGETQGRGKLDVKHEHAIPKKDIWLYPLSKNFKQVLCT
jgi:hypothetical protein